MGEHKLPGSGRQIPGLLPKSLVAADPAEYAGTTTELGERCIGLWHSRRYHVRAYSVPNNDDVVRLSIIRWHGRGTAWESGITWDELQSLKAQCGYGDRWAVEIYPADAERVADVNMRHLWILADAPPFAWRADAIAADPLTVAARHDTHVRLDRVAAAMKAKPRRRAVKGTAK